MIWHAATGDEFILKGRVRRWLEGQVGMSVLRTDSIVPGMLFALHNWWVLFFLKLLKLMSSDWTQIAIWGSISSMFEDFWTCNIVAVLFIGMSCLRLHKIWWNWMYITLQQLTLVAGGCRRQLKGQAQFTAESFQILNSNLLILRTLLYPSNGLMDSSECAQYCNVLLKKVPMRLWQGSERKKSNDQRDGSHGRIRHSLLPKRLSPFTFEHDVGPSSY